MRYLILLLLLTGCGVSDIFTPVMVKVPIIAKCDVQIPNEPDWNVQHLAADAGLLDKLKAVLSDAELNKGYDEQLVAALNACHQ